MSREALTAFEGELIRTRDARFASALRSDFDEAAEVEAAALLRLVRAGREEAVELGFQSDNHIYAFLQLHFFLRRHPPRPAIGERVVAYLQHLDLEPEARLSFAKTLLTMPPPEAVSSGGD